MAKTLTLNGKEYDIDSLSDEAKRLANNIIFCDGKLNQLQSEGAVIQTARNTYIQALTNKLENPAKDGD